MISEKQRTRLLTIILIVSGVIMLFGYFRSRSRNEAITEKYYDLHFRYKEQEAKMDKLRGVLKELQTSLDNCKAEENAGTTRIPE